jgi:RNA 3'-terminal phosphate cyclase
MGCQFPFPLVYLYLFCLGTKLRYKPGVLMGGKKHLHDCGLSRSIGYFLEPLILLGLFGKKPLTIRLKGSLIVSF